VSVGRTPRITRRRNSFRSEIHVEHSFGTSFIYRIWGASQRVRNSCSTDTALDVTVVNCAVNPKSEGKGRKERCTPLAKSTVAVLKAWLRQPQRGHQEVLFPNARGGRLSADGVHYLFVRHCAAASKVCPSLKHKRVTVHVLRHYAGSPPMPGR
jgi:integrase